MSTGTITPYRSGQKSGRDDFPHLLRAEWTKFRTVRGWVIAMVAAALLTALAVVALAGVSSGSQNAGAHPTVAIGLGGEAVTDNFYFVHQSLDGNGSITARVASLDTELPTPTGSTFPHIAVPWAKAGIIIKASTRPGSAYAAVMATPAHGVRMQYDYTHDTTGLSGTVSAASPRWLRLTRSGDTITGYDSADGRHWAEIGTASLAGLPSTVQAGLFVTSPPLLVPNNSLSCRKAACSAGTPGQSFAGNSSLFSYTTQATAALDHVSLRGERRAKGDGEAGGAWRGGQIGFPTGIAFLCTPSPGHFCPKTPAGGLKTSSGTFTVTGSGDIAPYVTDVDPLGTVLKGSLAGLLAVIALGALFITAEYRRGLIHTTFAASPRRGRVLAAKAIVIGLVTFAAGLAGAAVALPIAENKLHSGGWASSVYPVWSLTSSRGLQIVVGTAALLAVTAILALSAGAVLRRSAGAIAAVVVLLIVPLILGAILPQAPADWLLRLTPAAAFGLQQGTPHYSQVTNVCQPINGCYPLAPWEGLAVLCAWAAAALALAVFLLRRRDA
jgi:ABC-type transport system involved in multi-copper enzyme maturation permease subunit